MSRLCISGSRNFPEIEQSNVILAVEYLCSLWCEATKEVVSNINVGDCPTGVDKFIRQYYNNAHQDTRTLRVYLADWDWHGNRAGPIRNQEMIDVANVLLAFPLAKSRGTIDTIRRAKRKGIPVYIYQDGHIHLEKTNQIG